MLAPLYVRGGGLRRFRELEGGRRLSLVGVGFRAQAQGQKLNLQIGFSHPVAKEMPAGIKVE